MEPLVVEATPDSPAVLLDKAQGIFELKGRSMPEDPIEFYKPIIAWAADYVSEPNAVTEFVFRFEYFNTASSKRVLDLLMLLRPLIGSIRVRWYFCEGDDDMFDTGEAFAEITGIPFEVIPYNPLLNPSL